MYIYGIICIWNTCFSVRMHCLKCSHLNGKITSENDSKLLLELKILNVKTKPTTAFSFSTLTSTPFWTAAVGYTLIRKQVGTKLQIHGPQSSFINSSNFSHFPRKTRLQLGIKFPDQHTKPDLKHNNTKTRPRVLQNREKMHPRPTPHGVGCGGRNPSSCAARLACGPASFPSHWSPESFHCLSCWRIWGCRLHKAGRGRRLRWSEEWNRQEGAGV